jgi:hypothetical protein
MRTVDVRHVVVGTVYDFESAVCFIKQTSQLI